MLGMPPITQVGPTNNKGMRRGQDQSLRSRVRATHWIRLRIEGYHSQKQVVGAALMKPLSL